MIICLLNVLHDPLDKRVFQKIAMSLLQAGHEVVSIAPHAGGVLPVHRGLRFEFIPPVKRFSQRLRSLRLLVARGRRVRADVYYAPEPESWVAALVLKLLTGSKVVFDMHEHVPTEFAKFFPALMRPSVVWLTWKFMRLFARYTDYVILTRESFEPLWLGLAVPRVVVINTNHLQPRCTAIPKAVRLRYAGPVIIHQGIFGVVRGSWQLLEAVKRLVKEIPDLRCILLGSYVSGSEDEFRRAVDEAGLKDCIDMPGVVPYEEVPAYIAVSKVGLILFQPGPINHTLAMPHKLFDYMREACPVVAPDFAVEVARIVREADCGILVDVTSPAAIADAIRRLLDDPAEAVRLGENGRRLVEQKYHWQAEEKVLLQAFSELERR